MITLVKFLLLASLACYGQLRGLEPVEQPLAESFFESDDFSTDAVAEGYTVAPEEKFAEYEKQAKESFQVFKAKVDDYVNTLGDNETFASFSQNVRGFYRWAMNREGWETFAIFVITALVAGLLLSLILKTFAAIFSIVCLPFRCLTCLCCPRRRRRY